MYKHLTVFTVLFLVAVVAVGCGRREATPEGEIMPMSVSVDSGMTGTNMITKAGTPVEVSAPPESIPVEGAAVYTPPAAEEIQQALKNSGLYSGSVDGKIGPMTKKAITEFQQQNGLTADGKVGRRTWEKLKVYLNQDQQ